MTVWNTANSVLTLDRTLIMGILNVTPDSFSDGGDAFNPDAAVKRALQLQQDGADILDIGGQSTRPGHTPISWEEEWARLAPVLAALQGNLSIPISVDTFYREVAARAIDAGTAIINDVSGSLHNDMCALAAQTGAGLVLMNPQNDLGYFDNALAAADAAGLARKHVVLDIGIGFGKTRDDDRAALAAIPTLVQRYNRPVLVGASRKRITDPDDLLAPKDRLAATIALHTAAQLNGARILRVHDVKEAVAAACAIDLYKEKR